MGALFSLGFEACCGGNMSKLDNIHMLYLLRVEVDHVSLHDFQVPTFLEAQSSSEVVFAFFFF